MSHQGSTADETREKEATHEQIRELETRELAPETGVQKAENVRDQVQTIAELDELPSFKEAMRSIREIFSEEENPLELNRRLYELASEYSMLDLIWLKEIEGTGWYCESRENGPLTTKESGELADTINDTIDIAEMEKQAKKDAK